MKNQMGGKDPIGAVIKNVNRVINVFGLVGIVVVIWLFSSFFLEGC